MSGTPIYDELMNLKKATRASALYQAKFSILQWIEKEVKAGSLKDTADVRKIQKAVGEIKWEDIAPNDQESTGKKSGCTCATTGTTSKSRSSSASSKNSAGKSRASSSKAKTAAVAAAVKGETAK